MFLHYIDLSWRSFKRTPLVSGLMILAIAVGIGITMTSLSVYHMMSADPIPHKSERLFHPQLKTMDEGENWWTSDELPHQLTYKDAMNLYRADAPGTPTPSVRSGFSVYMADGSIKPFMEQVRLISNSFFTMFDMEFIEGAAWTELQEENAESVTVITESLREKLFGNESAIGKQVMYDDNMYRVVGVVKDFDHHIKFYDLTNGAFNRTERIFAPFTLVAPFQINNWGNTNGWKYQEIRNFEEFLESENFWIQFWVQLDTPQEVIEYREFLNNYLAEQATLGRFDRKEPVFELRSAKQWLDYNGVVSEDNRILVGLSFMFLAVCVANILGLLLGKFLRRVPEVGVRRALGANKRQVFLQHIVEVSLLGLIGSLFGIVIAQLGLWGVRATYSYYSALATMDISMFLAAPLIAIMACIVAGLYPAWLVCRTNPAICLKTQ